jgi:hypothetical protein
VTFPFLNIKPFDAGAMHNYAKLCESPKILLVMCTTPVAVCRQLEAHGICRVDLVLLSEFVRVSSRVASHPGESDTNTHTAEAHHPLAGYPINALRNESLKRALTELVLLLDVDFVVAENTQVAAFHNRYITIT